MYFVDEQHDRGDAVLDFVNDVAKALFKLAFHAGAGLQQANVEGEQLDVPQAGGYISRRNSAGKAFNHSRLADASLTRQQGIVLPAAREDVYDLPNFVVTTGYGVQLALARLLGQIHSILFERVALLGTSTAYGLAGVSWLISTGEPGAIVGRQAVFH